MKEQVFAQGVLVLNAQFALLKADNNISKEDKFAKYKEILTKVERLSSDFLSSEEEDGAYLLGESFLMQMRADLLKEIKRIDKNFRKNSLDDIILNLR